MRPEPSPVGPGQESVWDYPRPPRVEHVARRAVIRLGGEVIVDTDDVVRVLETSHPPVYYLPISAFAAGALTPGEGSSYCEFKGGARYFDVRGGGQLRPRAAWTYPKPGRGVRVPRGPGGGLRPRDGPVRDRRRRGAAAARAVLRRMDHPGDRRAVQGGTRLPGVVTRRRHHRGRIGHRDLHREHPARSLVERYIARYRRHIGTHSFRRSS